MIAKVTSINLRYCNRLETALATHLQKELHKDPQVIVDFVRETVEVFLAENKSSFRGCKAEKLTIMYGSKDACDFVSLMKEADGIFNRFNELFRVTFYDDNYFSPF